MSTVSPAVTIEFTYDDDADGAAEALLAVLRRPEPAPKTDDEPDAAPAEDAA